MLTRKNNMYIDAYVHTVAKKFQVQVLQYANSGNHLHLLIQAKTRKGFQNYLRTIAGLIARLVTGAIKGKAKGKFWDKLAYSRVVAWGRDAKNTTQYVFQNTLESFGFETPRKAGRPMQQLLRP